jgi:glycosyltransferase involved in cell wall biosynthesis
MAKISIITPVFNGAGFIAEAGNSVLAQSHDDWEWIIINDGSTDDTAIRLEKFEDPRIRIIHQENAGASAARNVGLDAAQGEYVTFLDADDVLPSEALALRSELLNTHPDVDIVNGGVHVTSEGKTLRHYRPDIVSGPIFDRLAHMEEGVFFGPFYMLRRASIGDHRFPVGVRHCEDLIFILELAAARGLRYAALPEIVYEYRVTSGSAMSNLNGIEAGYLEFLRRATALPEIDEATHAYQRRRVQRILFRSWLRRGKPLRALRAVTRVATMDIR